LTLQTVDTTPEINAEVILGYLLEQGLVQPMEGDALPV
jgi:hypothetical protein